VDTSKAEAAYQELRARIQDGTFAPGERLVLDRLARLLGVSPVPVREAIRRLEAEGYVDFTRNVGPRVAQVDIDAFAQSMQVLSVLESAALIGAAPKLTARQAAAARRINARLDRMLPRLDPLEFTRLNREFHFSLVARCPNQRLIGLLQAEWTRLDTIRRSVFAYAPERAAQSVAEHEEMIRLTQAGDPVAISQIVHQHRHGTTAALSAADLRSRDRHHLEEAAG
jgi:DNA-binding GntR family transcriptional regulator